jgi:hypothetical protein
MVRNIQLNEINDFLAMYVEIFSCKGRSSLCFYFITVFDGFSWSIKLITSRQLPTKQHYQIP